MKVNELVMRIFLEREDEKSLQQNELFVVVKAHLPGDPWAPGTELVRGVLMDRNNLALVVKSIVDSAYQIANEDKEGSDSNSRVLESGAFRSLSADNDPPGEEVVGVAHLFPHSAALAKRGGLIFAVSDSSLSFVIAMSSLDPFSLDCQGVGAISISAPGLDTEIWHGFLESNVLCSYVSQGKIRVTYGKMVISKSVADVLRRILGSSNVQNDDTVWADDVAVVTVLGLRGTLIPVIGMRGQVLEDQTSSSDVSEEEEEDDDDDDDDDDDNEGKKSRRSISTRTKSLTCYVNWNTDDDSFEDLLDNHREIEDDE